MYDSQRGVGSEGARRSTDGGDDTSWRAGDDPPPEPTNGTELLDRLGVDPPDSDRSYVVRVSLDAANEESALRVIEQLRSELTVHGTTLSLDVGPQRPGVFDVVVSMDYAPTTVVDALVEPAEIDAVTIARLTVPVDAAPDAGDAETAAAGDAETAAAGDESAAAAGDESAAAAGDESAAAAGDEGAEADDATVSEAISSVDARPAGGDAATGAGSRPPDTGTDGDGAGEGTDGSRADEAPDSPADEAAPSPGETSGRRAAVAGGAGATTGDEDAPEGTFDELKASTESVSYEELVAELDETTLPGEFGDEVDLGPLIEGDAEAGTPTTEPQGAPESASSTPTGGESPGLTGSGAPEPVEAGSTGQTDAPVANSDGGQTVGTAPSGAVGGGLDADRVVEALVTAVEEDAFTDEQRRTVADAFDVGPPKTMMVRVEHLQREVDELTAYREALEGFIEEYGTGEGLVQQVREVLEQFTEDVDAIEARLSALSGRVDDVDDRLAALDDVRSRIETHESRLDELSSLGARVEELESLEPRVSDLEANDERLDELESRVSEFADVDERLDELSSLGPRVASLEGLESRLEAVEELESRVEALESLESRLDALEELETRVADLEDVDERLAAVQSELEEVRAAAEAGPDDDVADRLDAVEERVDEFGDQVADLEAGVPDAETLSADLDAAERRLETLEAWHDRVRSAMAGPAPADATDEGPSTDGDDGVESGEGDDGVESGEGDDGVESGDGDE